MNIKTRIKKIEEKLNFNSSDSEFCDCWQKHWQSALKEAYDAHENGRAKDTSKIHPLPDYEKGYCDRCKKYISGIDIKMIARMVRIHGVRNSRRLTAIEN